MNISQINELKMLLAENEIYEAIEKAKDFFSKDRNINDLVLISSDYKELERNIRLGFISFEDARIQRTKVMHKLLYLFDNINSKPIRIYKGDSNEKLEDYIKLLELRAERINRVLGTYYPSINTNFFLHQFNSLQHSHIHFLKNEKFDLAHECLTDIFFLFQKAKEKDSELNKINGSAFSYLDKKGLSKEEPITNIYITGKDNHKLTEEEKTMLIGGRQSFLYKIVYKVSRSKPTKYEESKATFDYLKDL